jgi:hypothetical protein
MSKDKNINWEPDVKKGMDNLKNIKSINEILKKESDNRKIDGFNPSDLIKK